MANETVIISSTPLQFTPTSPSPNRLNVIDGISANDDQLPFKLPEPRIAVVDGTSANDEQFPFTAELSINTKNGGFLCSGSLITSDWVLTARHCIAG